MRCARCAGSLGVARERDWGLRGQGAADGDTRVREVLAPLARVYGEDGTEGGARRVCIPCVYTHAAPCRAASCSSVKAPREPTVCRHNKKSGNLWAGQGVGLKRGECDCVRRAMKITS